MKIRTCLFYLAIQLEIASATNHDFQNVNLRGTRALKKKGDKKSRNTYDENTIQAAPPLPFENNLEPTTDTIDPEKFASCTKGLFRYQTMDEETLEMTLDYYLNVKTGHCVVIDKPCPSFYDDDHITYSDCAPACLLPGAENPCQHNDEMIQAAPAFPMDSSGESNTPTIQITSNKTNNENTIQAAPPLPFENNLEPTTDTIDPEKFASCTKGLFRYQTMDEETLEMTLDYYLNVKTGHCVVIDKPCPSFYDDDHITYSDCAPACLLPGAENPC